MKPLKPDCPYSCNQGYVFLEARGRVECPHCLGVVHKAKRTDIQVEDNVYRDLCLPRTYWGLPETACYAFVDDIEQRKEQYTDVEMVTTVCRRMLDALSNGELYRDSLYITFGSQDTDRFVYSAQVLAALQGVGTVPYITLNKLSVLLFSESNLGVYDADDEDALTVPPNMNGRNSTIAMRVRRVYGGIDYTDYTVAPLVFLEMTPGTTDAGFLALADLLAERARLSLPTYVIGYCSAYKTALNGELLTIANYIGQGLRKLTPVSVLKKPYVTEHDAYLEHNYGLLDTLESYKVIDTSVKAFGVHI